MERNSSTAALLASLRADVATRAPGDQLPSSRELMHRYGVSPVTVARAIALLAAEGLVVTRPGSGTFAAPRRPAADPDGGTGASTAWQTVALGDRAVDARAALDVLRPPADGQIVLAGGYLHRTLQPTRALGAALVRAARRPDAWDRAPAAGLATLRVMFAQMLDGDVTADDVLVTSGGQSALSTAFRAIAAPGSPVLVESPTYPGALAAARAAGLRPVPVPTDTSGLRPDLLAEAFATSGARLLYCQPTFHNPTGAVLAPARRAQVLDVARAAGAFVVEDDFARLLGHRETVPRPLAAGDRDGTVVYLTSLTKAGGPSLRLGALVARGPVMERLRAMRIVDDFFVARPLQEAAVELLAAPAWTRHLRALAAALRERCAVLVAALARDLPAWAPACVPTGGLHLWVRLPTPEDEVTDAARAAGVAIGPGRHYFAAEPPGPFARLSFAAATDAAELAEAVRRLGARLDTTGR